MKLSHSFNIIVCSVLLISCGHDVIFPHHGFVATVIDLVGYSLALIGLFCSILSVIINKED